MQENIKQVIVKNTVRKEFKTAPIFQYDVGHVLSFEGFDLPEAFEVHFSLTEAGDAVTQVGSNNQVTVPDILVQDGRWLYAWLYISDQETGLTKFTIQIPVTRRARPTDQTPTPVEQSEIQQAIAALNAGVTRAETAAENAETAEENASQSAENAYNSSEAAASAAESAEGDARTATEKAQIAVNAAETATRKVQEASESAQLASQKASEASGFADNAQGSAQNASNSAQSAQGYAQTAGQKATEATQSAGNAAQKAQEALSSAQAAEGSANDADTAKRGAETARDGAQGYAGNASTSAQAAETAKNTAVEKAGEASQSATAAAQSARETAQTATQFAADITQLKSDIQAKQDAPSVAGTPGQVLGLDANLDPVWVDQTGGTVDDSALAPVIKSTSSGEIASFADGADNRLIDSLVVNIEPKQEGSGDASPDNVRPISGWTGVKLTRAGKNLLNLTADSLAYNINTGYDATIKRTQLEPGAIFIGVSSNNYWIGENTNRYIIAKGNGSISYRTNDASYGFGVCVEVKPLVGYTVSAAGSGYSVRIALYGQDGSWIKAINNSQTFTTTADAKYALIIFCCTNDTKNTDIAVSNIQLELSSASTDYSAYSGQTIQVEFPSEAGTVYSGSLTVNEDGTGTLVADLNEMVFDGVTNRLSLASNSYILSDYTRGYLSLSSRVADSSRRGEVICDFFPTSTNTGINVLKPINQSGRLELNFYIANDLTGIVYGEDTSTTATTKMNNWLKTNPVKVLYPRATPLTYTLTAEQISGILRTLKGQNNIWADCGDIESVEYSADTKLYIDNKLAQLAAQIVS